jgi:P27 family predicted phage terminase small subunit
MPSPKPRPAHLKIVEGRAPGRDSGGRKVTEPPSFVRLPPTAPDWLPAEARAEWDRVVPELQRLQLLKPPDAAALAAYCMAWARFVEACRIVEEQGMVLHDDKLGRSQRHPALLTAEAASKELRAWCGEFGLTPSAEARLATKGDDGGGEGENPFAGTG